jgi:hypothetical protein
MGQPSQLSLAQTQPAPILRIRSRQQLDAELAALCEAIHATLALLGGAAAGIVATAAQIVLWWLTSAPVQIVRKTEERRVRPHIIMLKELFLDVAFATPLPRFDAPSMQRPLPSSTGHSSLRVGPERTLRTFLALRIVDAFFMWAPDKCDRHIPPIWHPAGR